MKGTNEAADTLELLRRHMLRLRVQNAVLRIAARHHNLLQRHVFAIATLLATSVPLTLFAQEVPAKSPLGQRTFLGAANCVMCHNSGLPKADDANAAALEVLGFTGLANDSWVTLEELKLWANQDKHSQAFTSLLNERSQQMGKLLGVAEIHRDKRCLTCHTAYPLSAMGHGASLATAQ